LPDVVAENGKNFDRRNYIGRAYACKAVLLVTVMLYNEKETLRKIVHIPKHFFFASVFKFYPFSWKYILHLARAVRQVISDDTELEFRVQSLQ
jgi:hypothetical protein